MDWSPHYLYDQFFAGDPQAVDRFLEEIRFHEWNYGFDKGYPFKKAVVEHSARFPQYAALIQAFDTRWEETVGGPMEETVQVLRGLREAGYPLYGLSNWSREKFSGVQSRYDFFRCFEEIVISGDVRVAKPDPAIFRILLERIGRPAAECVFIDDSEMNIGVARTLGMKTIHFRSAEQLKDDLEKLGVSKTVFQSG